MARCRSCNERSDHDPVLLARCGGRCRACWWENRAGEIELERRAAERRAWALEARLRPFREALAAITNEPQDDPEIVHLRAERDHYANPANWHADDEYGPRLRNPAPTLAQPPQ